MWNEIWNKKGLEDTNDLNILSGFDMYNDKNDLKQFNMIVKQCNILKFETILEVGCGAGRLGNIFLENNYNYFGIDQSDTLIEKFKILVNNDKVKIMKNNIIPFKDKSFDIVFCYSVIQYIENMDKFKIFLSEMKRVSKRIVYLGDVESFNYSLDMQKNYKYTTETELKHLCIDKDYFMNYNNVKFNNDYCSKKTRYNVIINKINYTFGKIKVEKLFTLEEIKLILENINILKEKQDEKDYIWKYYNDNNSISRIEYFVNDSSFFKELSQNKKILDLVSKLMGEEVILFKDKINFKYSGEEGFVAHQDISAGWSNYTNKHINVGIPLVETNLDNGCLFFSTDNINQQLTENFKDLNQELNYQSLPTKIGDVILFDSYIPHKSFSNNTDLCRPIVYFTYTPKSEGNFYEKYHSDKFKNVPPDIYRDKNVKYRSNFKVGY